MVSVTERGSGRAANISSISHDITPLLLVTPPLLAGVLITLAVIAFALYVLAVSAARRRAHATAHRGERAAWRHHMALLLHVAALDCASSLIVAPLELTSLVARGVWWPLPRYNSLCRAALGLDAFLSASTNYGLAALTLHATSSSPLQLQSHSTFPPRPLRCLRMPASLPLIWTISGFLSAPMVSFGQLLPDPGGGVICAIMLSPRIGWGGWDRLLMALCRTIFCLGVPLTLLVISGVRATVRLCTKTEYSRLNIVALLWSISFALFSLHRAVFAAIFAFQQAFSDHPTHSVPPFVSITSPLATFLFAVLHYFTCALRPFLYCATFYTAKS